MFLKVRRRIVGSRVIVYLLEYDSAGESSGSSLIAFRTGSLIWVDADSVGNVAG